MEIHWQQFVDRFELRKSGANPWDASILVNNLIGASNAERQVILFLLHIWDPAGDWPEPFDFFEAYTNWDPDKIVALRDWMDHPLWP